MRIKLYLLEWGASIPRESSRKLPSVAASNAKSEVVAVCANNKAIDLNTNSGLFSLAMCFRSTQEQHSASNGAQPTSDTTQNIQ